MSVLFLAAVGQCFPCGGPAFTLPAFGQVGCLEFLLHSAYVRMSARIVFPAPALLRWWSGLHFPQLVGGLLLFFSGGVVFSIWPVGLCWVGISPVEEGDTPCLALFISGVPGLFFFLREFRLLASVI